MEIRNEETQKGNTFKLGICFEIDVPKNFGESIFNSIILGLHEYKTRENEEWNCDIDKKTNIQNNLLMRLQNEIEQLIVKKL